MTSKRRDPSGSQGTDLLPALARLATAPEHDLLARVFAYWCRVETPIGALYVAFTDQGTCYLRTAASVDDDGERFREAFRERFRRPLRPAEQPPAGLLPALRGSNRDVPLDLRGLTSFERDVLDATAHIPTGQLRPYSWVAKEIGRPGAVRAVGSALGRNPVPVLIPCHRVTRADGDVGEYVFGREVKEELLRHESVDLDEVRRLAGRRVFYVGSDTTNIVCFPTCHHARRITPQHRKGFRSITEAEEAGFRPCLTCRPGAVAA